MTKKSNGYRMAAVTAAALSICLTSAQRPAPFVQSLPDSIVKIEMVPVPGGPITIGKRAVQVKPFFMSKTEVPWELFDLFLASGPPSPPYDQTKFAPDAIARPSKSYILPDLGWGHSGYPVINVSFTSAEMFCRWLSSVTKRKYRLPTEAEWELAARGGEKGPLKLDKTQADRIAWHKGNSDETTHPVGKKAPNKFGLHDMLGNAGEWATDLEGKPILCGPTFLDPLASLQPDLRRRWSPKWQETDPQIPKSRWWLSDGPFAGFRVVCEP
ncbi:MAG TPA: SUMF1/EgtB/PvdO family nonheme iron enzyme [Fimbriimonadaceae bacterium]|nr:SUMF1/EgtB/PvdO family nonheme iron enzyme [Fimbriimonadaceae bacterium]